MTGYEPLNFLKPVAPDIWIIDGPAIRFYGMPFPTRATVVRLHNGDLWVHSPTHLTEDLVADLRALGPVRHLIAPNWIHYAWVEYWQAAFEEAEAWAAPGVLQRARRHGKALRFDHELGDAAPPEWAGQIDQMMVKGSAVHREVVFFHCASRTLILTDLIENFEPSKCPWWMRPLLRLGGIADPDGSMPRDMRLTFRKGRAELRAAVETMIGWSPERIILAHGRWYDRRRRGRVETGLSLRSVTLLRSHRDGGLSGRSSLPPIPCALSGAARSEVRTPKGSRFAGG